MAATNPIYERVGPIFMLAGLGFFALAFASMGYLPWAHLSGLPELTVEQMIAGGVLGDDGPRGVTEDFVDLATRYPEPFARYYGKPDQAAFAKALRLGRDVYVSEACWHCHSQQIRPVGGETQRFGRVSTVSEYANELQRPHMFGTRRVGPDLIRMAGKYANDWHVAHLYDPRIVVPTSVMPRYPWFFEEDAQGNPVPNERGLAMVTYIQWLGSWVPEEERLY